MNILSNNIIENFKQYTITWTNIIFSSLLSSIQLFIDLFINLSILSKV